MAGAFDLGLDQAVQSIKDAAGIVSTKGNNTASVPPLPWQQSNISSTFFHSLKIDPTRWDTLFPYRLMVIDSTNNTIVQGPKNKGVLIVPKITVTKGTGSAIVDFEPPDYSWIMQLPITPQQLSIQDQFAINTTPTLRGILEEHSGVRFKMINAQGSLGVWTQRSSINKPPSTPGLVQSLFGGTIGAIGSVVNSVSNLVSAVSGHPANAPVSLRPETSDFGMMSTGYYQALKLEQFFEQYAEAKKDPKNAAWRLVFDIPKQNQSFVVTPIVYNWQQNMNRPMEILFNFQLKAWRRIDLSIKATEVNPNNQPISAGILQRIMNTIDFARQTMSSILNLVQAVTSDLEAPLAILRQLTLFVKDLAGVIISVADLPNQLVSDYSSAWQSSMASLSTSIKSVSSDITTIAALAAVAAATAVSEGLSQAAVAGGQLGNTAAAVQTLNPTNAISGQPAAYYGLLSQIPITALSLTAAQQNQVNNVIATARATTVAQLKQNRAAILNLAIQLSNSFGTGSSYYNDLFSLSPPITSLIPITLDEYDILKSLYDVLTSFDILTATTQVDDDNIENAIQYVAGLASTADITFVTPTAKVLAPVPFGLTIEGIAARYLADPQRWLEIVTLNGLREPYIDEVGFQLPLLSNALGRQITVGSNTDLYIGQLVYLNGAGQTMSARTILGIEQLSDTSFLITLDGLANLGNFTLANGAYMQAYLPGTVNSQQQIYIPSDLPIPTLSDIIPPPGTTSDPLTGISGVDLLLQDSGDLAVNNFGDFRYSYGLTNIIQALRIKFGTQAGKVLLHPNFGLTITPGTMSSELQIQDLYNSIQQLITDDPRFSGISSLQIALNGPVLAINLGVTIAGQNGVFPVTFALT